jgi:hypothetical protein
MLCKLCNREASLNKRIKKQTINYASHIRTRWCSGKFLDLYSGDSAVESRTRYRLSPLRFLVVFLGPSSYMPGYYLNLARTTSFQILSTLSLISFRIMCLKHPASSSHSDIDRYSIIRKSVDFIFSIRMRTKFAIPEISLNTHPFYHEAAY